MSTATLYRPSRLNRIIDFGGLGLLVIAVGCYLRAYMGMSALEASRGVVASKARYAGLAEYDRFWELSRFSLWLGAAAFLALAIGGVITWRDRRDARTASAEALDGASEAPDR